MLAKKTELNESLRTDLHTLQLKFDALTIEKTNLETRLEEAVQETTTIRNQIAAAPASGPVFLQGEVSRLTKALESKTGDFNYLTARYQDASLAAAESAAEVVELKREVENLKRRVETDVKAVSWEGERKALMDKIQALEERCKLLEDREQRVQKKQGEGGTSVLG
jgi:prophage DNA circulation protein